MDSFSLLLLLTVLLRGLGAGMITGILFLTMPARARLDQVSYARALRAMYQAWGVKVYAVVTILGLLLTIVALTLSVTRGEDGVMSGLLIACLAATLGGFIGTAGAFPTMRRLWAAPDENRELVAVLVTRFGRWGIASALCHLLAFASVLGTLLALS
jgi:hypothetical protein